MSDRRLGIIEHPANGQPHVLDGLELIDPFYYYDWENCRVYTTKSIGLGPSGNPEDFVIATSFANYVPEFRTGIYSPTCVGSFFAKMNEEEQAQFLKNYEKLHKILMLSKDLKL